MQRLKSISPAGCSPVQPWPPRARARRYTSEKTWGTYTHTQGTCVRFTSIRVRDRDDGSGVVLGRAGRGLFYFGFLF
jgi:hypothetical protein